MILADEVGMGKTIEAGLVLKELKLRGMVDRVLVLAPKSLLLQWVSEMDALFDETFDLVLPGSWSADVTVRGDNPWRRYAQVVTSVDSVKPRDTHRGWSSEKLAQYNLERFHDMVAAGWDLAIIDESHKVAGASDDVSRHELAKELAKAVPHLLLLTATPHSGKRDAFRRLLSLIDGGSFLEGVPLTRDRVDAVVIRTEKRSATDAEGRALFAPRETRLVTVPFGPGHGLQKQLYEDVSAYVVAGYNRASGGTDHGFRLLLILIQRLMSSSTRAVRRFLEQRLEVLSGGTDSGAAGNLDHIAATADDEDLDEVVQAVLFTVEPAAEERGDVERLLALAVRTENAGPDARAEALYREMIRLAQDETDPSMKYLVFTEFTATQEMLAEFLEQRGYKVALLNGSMDIGTRRQAQEQFRTEAQVLLSTDAGGEGLNMQFAHVVFNYDLPWNPMRVEQRIGRVDRIGQTRPVMATNLVIENSVEARLYDVWQDKLATILAELGVDKTGDVLDSSQAAASFEQLARTALVNPDAFDKEFEGIVREIRRAAEEARSTHALYSGKVSEEDRPGKVPLRAWLRTAAGGDREGASTEGESADLSQDLIGRINALRPWFAEGHPVPRLQVNGLGFAADGWFSVWQVGIADGPWCQQNVFALFTTPNGQCYDRTAQRLWDELAAGGLRVDITGEENDYDFSVIRGFAERVASDLFDAMVQKTRARTRKRLEALELSYLARKEVVARIGLEPVRLARQRDLDKEYVSRRAELSEAEEVLPILQCLFLSKVDAV
jgi:superfamily II DNA or RNA helicase